MNKLYKAITKRENYFQKFQKPSFELIWNLGDKAQKIYSFQDPKFRVKKR